MGSLVLCFLLASIFQDSKILDICRLRANSKTSKSQWEMLKSRCNSNSKQQAETQEKRAESKWLLLELGNIDETDHGIGRNSGILITIRQLSKTLQRQKKFKIRSRPKMTFQDFLTKEWRQLLDLTKGLKPMLQRSRKKRHWIKFDRTSYLQVEFQLQFRTTHIASIARYLSLWDPSTAYFVINVCLALRCTTLRLVIVLGSLIDATTLFWCSGANSGALVMMLYLSITL